MNLGTPSVTTSSHVALEVPLVEFIEDHEPVS
jgi:hypothetical protein